ncbi:hypothetical protein CMO93_03135 [Candidatus Woesearchaeota archaeon]|nr:hypothetical protein [Candidatus Woesearchaeota archaeon]|tara:strand:+ start:1017 stop:1304 length:288 start_codon:yes stop_codon:yes gene_type:complete
MPSVTFAIPDKVKSEMKKLSWVNWSELAREEVIKREKLLKQLESKEEQELIKWSVELGRKAKKGRFKRLLSELSPKKREELLKSLSPEKREEALR